MGCPFHTRTSKAYLAPQNIGLNIAYCGLNITVDITEVISQLLPSLRENYSVTTE